MKVMLALFACLVTSFAISQTTVKFSKPVLDTAALRTRWQFGTANSEVCLSHDGKYIAYTVNNTAPQEGKTFIIQSIDGNWKKSFPVSRGQYSMITGDSKQLLFQGNADSVSVVTLGTDRIDYLKDVSTFNVVNNPSGEWLICQTSKGDYLIKKTRTSIEWQLKNVLSYQFDRKGTSLLIKTFEQQDSVRLSVLEWMDLQTGAVHPVWKGTKQLGESCFDPSGEQICFTLPDDSFTGEYAVSIWHCRKDQPAPQMLADSRTAPLLSNFMLQGNCHFSEDGKRIFFTISEKRLPKAPDNAVKVDVWSYQDLVPQFEQLQSNLTSPHKFVSVIDISTGKVMRLQQDNESVLTDRGPANNGIVVWLDKSREGWWNPAGRSSLYWVSAEDGSRTLIKDRIIYPPHNGLFNSSPDGRWILYFDRETRAWYSFDTQERVVRNTSRQIPFGMHNENSAQFFTNWQLEAVGIAGWLEEDKGVLIYDDYDIWEVDPTGEKMPVNITKGYGRSHHTKLRITFQQDDQEKIIKRGDTLLLSAFNPQTKYNGFYRMVIGKTNDPVELIMSPEVMYVNSSQERNGCSIVYSCWLSKARNANVWALIRRSISQAPNYFITKDFKTFTPLTDIQPQKKYNWITSELINCKLPDGKYTQAAVYKPENFDPKKKYPVIFSYYEQLSSDVYDYPEISYTYAKLNIPYFVSRGYIVCTPDIHYRIGHPGQSALEAVEAAAAYLSAKPWVDSRHLGLQGHSFGGSETNYIITHSHLFAAAEEGAGVSDVISAYGRGHDGIAGNWYFETGQGRIGANPWDHQELFIENSAVLWADKITTPLLIMHNKKDGQVAFGQGVEMFTAMRRLGKRVWLLQYDKSGHSVDEQEEQVDHTIRLEQFFDHYLKGTPPPKWMTQGIPAERKGLDTGYELDINAGELQEKPVLFRGKIQKVSDALSNPFNVTLFHGN